MLSCPKLWASKSHQRGVYRVAPTGNCYRFLLTEAVGARIPQPWDCAMSRNVPAPCPCQSLRVAAIDFAELIGVAETWGNLSRSEYLRWEGWSST